MTQMSIVPGQFFGHRRAVCWACGWEGENRTVRHVAQADADAHACTKPRLPQDPVAVPTEGA